MAAIKKKPLQVYLREDQFEALKSAAERRGESMAALIRQSVDMLLEGLPASEDPLLDIIGLYDSGQSDLAERHDDHLVELLKKESDHEP